MGETVIVLVLMFAQTLGGMRNGISETLLMLGVWQ